MYTFIIIYIMYKLFIDSYIIIINSNNTNLIDLELGQIYSKLSLHLGKVFTFRSFFDLTMR